MGAYTIKNAANTKHSLKIYDENDFYHYFQNNNGSPQNEAPQKELKFKKLGSLDDRSELSDEMGDCAKSFPSIESLKQTLLTGSLMGVGSDYVQNVSIVLINHYQLNFYTTISDHQGVCCILASNLL